MPTNNPYHEQEEILIVGKSPASRKELHSFLKGNGFKSIDDFYVYGRKDRPKVWQSTDILSISPAYREKDIYETEEDVEEGSSTYWDTLKCHYLMATLPSECIGAAVNLVEAISNHYDAQLVFGGKVVSPPELRESFLAIASSLESTYAAVGSEELAILIAAEYPRR